MSDCAKQYRQYKRFCEVVYSNINCQINEIEFMNIDEIKEFIKKVVKLKYRSEKCVQLRLEHRKNCISQDLQDQGHLHAINKAKKYVEICEESLKELYKRIKVLLHEKYKIQTETIQLLTPPTSPTKVVTKNRRKKQLKKENEHIKTETFEEFLEILDKITKDFNETTNEQVIDEYSKWIIPVTSLELAEVDKINKIKQNFVDTISDSLYNFIHNPQIKLILEKVLKNLNIEDLMNPSIINTFILSTFVENVNDNGITDLSKVILKSTKLIQKDFEDTEITFHLNNKNKTFSIFSSSLIYKTLRSIDGNKNRITSKSDYLHKIKTKLQEKNINVSDEELIDITKEISVMVCSTLLFLYTVHEIQSYISESLDDNLLPIVEIDINSISLIVESILIRRNLIKIKIEMKDIKKEITKQLNVTMKRQNIQEKYKKRFQNVIISYLCNIDKNIWLKNLETDQVPTIDLNNLSKYQLEVLYYLLRNMGDAYVLITKLILGPYFSIET